MKVGIVLSIHEINTKRFDEALKARIFENNISCDFGYEIEEIYNLKNYIDSCTEDVRVINGVDKFIIKDTVVNSLDYNKDTDTLIDKLEQAVRKYNCAWNDVLVILDID